MSLDRTLKERVNGGKIGGGKKSRAYQEAPRCGKKGRCYEEAQSCSAQGCRDTDNAQRSVNYAIIA